MAERPQDPDPMTETTRKMRRMLLIVSSLLLLLQAVPAMEPTEIPALGVKFTNTGQKGGPVMGIIFIMNAYLLVAFVWYAIRDVRFQRAGQFVDVALVTFSASEIIRRLVDHPVRVPMQGRVASLNVGTASAVILFELRRQSLGSRTPTGSRGDGG